MLESFRRDCTHGARLLRNHPGFTLVAAASIAIGVGVNAAMFSIADALVFRPLPVPRPGEIMTVTGIAPRGGQTSSRQLSYPDYADLRDGARTFAGLAAYRVVQAGMAASPGELPQSTLGLAVSGNFFDVLEVEPARGRFFRPGEDSVPGRDRVLVLSHESWTTRFGADPGVIDRQVRLGGLDFLIVGVAPASFTGVHLVLHPAYYVPAAALPLLAGNARDVLARRDQRGFDVIGRLNTGVSLERAREDATLIAQRLEARYPGTNSNYGLLVQRELETRAETRGQAVPTVLMLMTLAAAVLLVACANVAGLLVSRAPERAREIALRLAIGGGRVRVARQLITESLLLAAGGGAAGLLLGYAVIAFFQQGPPLVSDIGVRLIFRFDRRVVVIGLTLAFACALAASLLPAWRASRASDLVGALRAGTGARGGRRLWGPNVLVAAQLALALTVLAVAGALSGAGRAALGQPGFRTSGMLLTTIEPGLAGYDASRTRAFYEALTARAGTMAGVTAVGMTDSMPLNQDARDSIMIVPEGFALPPEAPGLRVLRSRIDAGYLGTMDIPIVSGRPFTAADAAGAPRVVLVNQAMAARFWSGESPIGRRIRLLNYEGQPWAEVVGVTADAKYAWIGEAPTPWLYMPQAQDPVGRSTLVLATDGDSSALVSHLREAVRAIDPNMPIGSIRTIEEYYRGNATRIAGMIGGVTSGMSVLGLALAAVGLYGVVAFGVARRAREIGIRMAVGARSAAILRMVLRQGLVLTMAGVAAGVIGSIAAGGLVRAVFPTATGIGVVNVLMAALLLALVALAATAIPARRAARTDPLTVLRQE